WHRTKDYFYQYPISVPRSIKYNITQLEAVTDQGSHQAIIEVTDTDSFVMAIDYVSQGLSPLVLNMASDYCPGGGVGSGKIAQEEELFRRSNAHQTHPRHWYPLKKYEIIY